MSTLYSSFNHFPLFPSPSNDSFSHPFRTNIPNQSHLVERRVHLDAYARRHEGQKIYLRQAAAQRWIEWRAQILMGGRPHSGNQPQLRACDQQLRAVSHPHLSVILLDLLLTKGFFKRQELATITDESIYAELQASDISMGRWTSEDPSLRAVQRWVRSRRR